MPTLTKQQSRILAWLSEHRDAADIDLPTIATALGLSEAVTKADIQVLQEMEFVSGPPSLLTRCRTLLKDLDEDIDRTSEAFPSYIVLVASILDRAEDDYLAAELGYDRDFVSLVGTRLRNAKIWQRDELAPMVRARWQGEGGGVAFWLDAHVAAGTMECLDGDTDSPSYEMTAEGKRIIERAIGKRPYR